LEEVGKQQAKKTASRFALKLRATNATSPHERNKAKTNGYFTISRFFQRRFLPLHFLHFTAVSAFRAPQSLQIFMYRRCFCAMDFLTGSNMGIFLLTFHFG